MNREHPYHGYYGSSGDSGIIHAEILTLFHGLQLCWDMGYIEMLHASHT
jgi:hypothetical protein